MQRLDSFASQNQVVDLGPWLQYYAFDVVGMFTFDKKFGFLEQGKDIDSIMSTIEFILAYSAIIGQVPALHLLLLGNPLLIKLMPPMEQWNQIVQFTLKAMRERAEMKPGGEYTVSNTDGKDFLSKLASSKSSEDEKMNVRDLVIALAGNVFAGSDTTAIALRAIVYYLCRYPKCLAKLADEIMKHDKDSKLSSPINFKEASAIPYLSAVIKEAMRLHPSVGLILERHVPPQGVEIEGHFLPGRSVVGVNPWVTGRNAETFPQPNEFRPERWLEVPEQELRAMDNLLEFNFGAGARKCLGRHMAWIKMMKVIPELIRRFEIEFADPEKDWHVTNHW
ncbi:hypothetical protein LTR64_005451 [Lithohypha guttulata]|uniref:uncharacterized protein n=1 Tax=Lithohypha guttulata TaxID=1690604 RepID=UPI002DE0E61C|nr:hypothetical protein LTR51_002756 [Lithohypha guttulata]